MNATSKGFLKPIPEFLGGLRIPVEHPSEDNYTKNRVMVKRAAGAVMAFSSYLGQISESL